MSTDSSAFDDELDESKQWTADLDGGDGDDSISVSGSSRSSNGRTDITISGGAGDDSIEVTDQSAGSASGPMATVMDLPVLKLMRGTAAMDSTLRCSARNHHHWWWQ